jgi:CheY-like chemotaxis protein
MMPKTKGVIKDATKNEKKAPPKKASSGKSQKQKFSNTVVIVDDEIHNMLWMIDYLESKGFKTITASNLNDALALIEGAFYRALIIDLNIPVLDPLNAVLDKLESVYKIYPGLYVAKQARNKGYRNRQVMIYSVHKDASVASEAEKLDCTYILKGRPKEIKGEIDQVVSYSPDK